MFYGLLCVTLCPILFCNQCCVALPRGPMGLSAVCDVVFPDHTPLLFK